MGVFVLPPDYIEVAHERVAVIDGEPVSIATWRFRRFQTIGTDGESQGDVAQHHSVADAAAECQFWLDQGIPVYPTAGGWL